MKPKLKYKEPHEEDLEKFIELSPYPIARIIVDMAIATEAIDLQGVKPETFNNIKKLADETHPDAREAIVKGQADVALSLVFYLKALLDLAVYAGNRKRKSQDDCQS